MYEEKRAAWKKRGHKETVPNIKLKLPFKGTVSVISIDPSCKEENCSFENLI